MNCVNFESIVDELARNRMMEAGVREQALLHSSACGACAVRLQEEQTLTQGLHELAGAMMEECASGEIEAGLAVAFREHHASLNGVGSVSIPSSPVHFSRAGRRYWKYAAAAGILLAVALGISVSRFSPSQPSTTPAAGKDASAALPPPGDNDTPPVNSGHESPATGKPLGPTPRVGPSKRASASRTRAARYSVTVQSLNVLTPTVEVTTEFIPIGYSSAQNVQEGGQVVRLEMPRYAMTRFGVPINEERYAEMVKADVWVGADGLARAIRFVQ